MSRELKKLGEFKVKSGKLFLSDPCYSREIWCQIKDIEAENGDWNAFVIESDDNHWDNGNNICAELLASHNDALSIFQTIFDQGEELPSEVGVDSGQAGIYDDEAFHSEDENWYDKNCNITVKNKAGVLDGGCVSRSGYGDGDYPAYVVRRNNKVVGVRIKFI